MKTKTIEQIALFIGLAILLYTYFTKSSFFGITTPASPALANAGASNGLPWFLSYNVPSGFTGGVNTEPLPSGASGSIQPPPVIYSFFPQANNAQT